MYRRARPPGLAESLRVQLARPGGVRYLALEARHRLGAALANGRATSDRGGHRGRRAEPHAGAGTPGVRPHRITRNTGGLSAPVPPIHATRCNKAPLPGYLLCAGGTGLCALAALIGDFASIFV